MSQEHGKINSSVLESAWQRYAEFDANSRAATQMRSYLLQATIALAVIAVVLSVFIGSYDTYLLLPETFKTTLQVILIVVLILDFIALANTIKNQPLENAKVLRAAAEEIKKEIYFYRTVLQWHEERDQWLSQRLTDIPRNVADKFSSELSLQPYRGPVPPYYDPLLCKFCVWDTDRPHAMARARVSLQELVIEGITTTKDFHIWVLDQDDFATGSFHTRTIEEEWLPRYTSAQGRASM